MLLCYSDRIHRAFCALFRGSAPNEKIRGRPDLIMEEKEVVSKNFIELAIDKDLAEGVYDHVCTRFRRSQTAIFISDMQKSILLNYGLSQEYNGEFHMRFDDTNPTKEKTEFVDSIKKADIQWLGADWKDHLYYASDYFPQMYEAAVKLIKKGKAFVCDLSAEEIREYRGTLTEPGKREPVPQSFRRGKPGPVRAHEKRRVRGRKQKYCVRKLIWHPQTSICVIRLFIV